MSLRLRRFCGVSTQRLVSSPYLSYLFGEILLEKKFRLQFVLMDEKVESLAIIPSRNKRVIESLYVFIIAIKIPEPVKQYVRFHTIHL